LCTAGGVLRSAAGDELCVAVLEEIFIEIHVLVLCENGVIGLETILLEHGIVAVIVKLAKMDVAFGFVCLPNALDILMRHVSGIGLNTLRIVPSKGFSRQMSAYFLDADIVTAVNGCQLVFEYEMIRCWWVGGVDQSCRFLCTTFNACISFM